MDWPAKEDIIQAPSSYEALEGYPGVYVCVEVRLQVIIEWLGLSTATESRRVVETALLKGKLPSSRTVTVPTMTTPLFLQRV